MDKEVNSAEVFGRLCRTRLTRNATSLAKRIRSAQALKLILHEELSAMEGHRRAGLAELDRLDALTRQMTSDLVEQVDEPKLDFGKILEMVSCS